MKCLSIILMLLVFGIACDTNPSANLVLAPGIGIRGVVEVGMTNRLVNISKRKIRAEENTWVGSWDMAVPSLGLSWVVLSKDKDAPISSIEAMVSSATLAECSINNVWYKDFTRFTGNTSEGLSFAKDGGVTHDEVIRLYGVPMHIIPFEKNREKAQENARRLVYLRRIEESYIYESDVTGRNGVIFYPGIIFSYRNNYVDIVTIFSTLKGIGRTVVPNSSTNKNKRYNTLD